MCRWKRPSGLRVQSGLSRRCRRGWRRFGSRLFRGFLRCRLFGSFFSSRLFRGRFFLGDGFFSGLLNSFFGSRLFRRYFLGRWLFGRRLLRCSLFGDGLFSCRFLGHRLLRCYLFSNRLFDCRFLLGGGLLRCYFLCCRLFGGDFLCGGLGFCGRFFCSCHKVLLDQVNRSLGGKHFVRLCGHTKRSMALDPGPAP